MTMVAAPVTRRQLTELATMREDEIRELGNIPDSVPIPDEVFTEEIPDCRFDQLSTMQIHVLNIRAACTQTINGQHVPPTWVTPEIAAEIAGIREIRYNDEERTVTDPETGEESVQVFNVPEKHDFSIKLKAEKTVKKYVMEKQRTNRFLSVEKMKGWGEQMLLGYSSETPSGRWCLNGETMIVDDTDQGLSNQHRLGGLFWAGLQEPGICIPVNLVQYTPAQFANTIDTGRSRTSGDQNFRDPSKLPDELLVDLTGNPYDEAAKVRQILSRELAGVCRKIALRAQGKDIKSSSPGGPVGTKIQFHVQDHYGESLQRLIVTVYNYDVGNTGKTSWGTLLSRADVATALALWQSKDYPTFDPKEPQNDVEQIEIDVDACVDFLKDLATTFATNEGPLSVGLEKIKSKNKDGQKQPPLYKFNSLVNLIKAWESGDDQSLIVPKSGSIDAESYCFFGGVDQGPKEKEKKEKKS